MKHKPHTKLVLPHWPEDEGHKLSGMHNQAFCSLVDLTLAKTPNLMKRLEKQFGKEITTRTWKTVERILKALE